MLEKAQFSPMPLVPITHVWQCQNCTANGALPKTIDEQDRPIGVVRQRRIVEAAKGSRPGHPLLATVTERT
jgi:hypothetical protein